LRKRAQDQIKAQPEKSLARPALHVARTVHGLAFADASTLAIILLAIVGLSMLAWQAAGVFSARSDPPQPSAASQSLPAQ
jgi:hypothetical protein